MDTRGASVEGNVDKDTMGCIAATDHWSGTQEELMFVLDEHVRIQHTKPTVEQTYLVSKFSPASETKR